MYLPSERFPVLLSIEEYSTIKNMLLMTKKKQHFYKFALLFLLDLSLKYGTIQDYIEVRHLWK